MRGSTRALVLTAALAACAMTSAHADDNSTLEERMSFKDFTRLGLDKLSPEQLKGLNEWMKTHGGPMCPTGIMAPAAGAAPMAAGAAPAAEKDKYSARLVGEFKGWEKGTILRLADGTAWEVRDDDPFIAHSATPPTITVEKSLIAGWRLSVSGYNEVARVIPAK